MDIELIQFKLAHIAIDIDDVMQYYIFYKEDVPKLLAKIEEYEAILKRDKF